jgi:hypothetical protein
MCAGMHSEANLSKPDGNTRQPDSTRVGRLVKNFFGSDDVPSPDRWRDPSRLSGSGKLDIDKAIWDLEEAAAMRSRTVLQRSLKGASLHYDVRRYLLDAFIDAQCAARDWEADRIIKQKQSALAEDAAKIHKLLEAFLLQHESGQPGTGLGVLIHTPRTPGLRGTARFDGDLWGPASQVRMAHLVLREAAAALKFLGSRANQKSQLLSGKGRSRHSEIAFVEHIARYFYFLTGKNPTSGATSDFAKFLNGACDAVGFHKMSGSQFETVAERMKKAPAWDQFHRDGPDRPLIVRRTREEQLRHLERLAAMGHPEASEKLPMVRRMSEIAEAAGKANQMGHDGGGSPGLPPENGGSVKG